MSRENPDQSRAGLAVWYARHLRLSTFHAVNALNTNEGLWRNLIGEDPESSVGKPKTGERAEVGQHAGATINLNIKAREGRVDWILSDSMADVFDPSDAPDPNLVGRLELYRNLMGRWLAQMAPPITRLAVAGVANLPVANREEGYVVLSRYLNFDLDPATSSDFLFQINRFRTSNSITDLRVNRLTKWSVSSKVVRSMRMRIGATVDTAVNWDEGPPKTYACQLDADLNTSSQENPLPHGRLPLQFDELVGMFEELLREGDV